MLLILVNHKTLPVKKWKQHKKKLKPDRSAAEGKENKVM